MVSVVKHSSMMAWLLMFSGAVAAQAAVIAVPADQPNIQAAIQAAVNGDTIQVAPGTYLENINFLGKAIQVISVQVTANHGDRRQSSRSRRYIQFR